MYRKKSASIALPAILALGAGALVVISSSANAQSEDVAAVLVKPTTMASTDAEGSIEQVESAKGTVGVTTRSVQRKRASVLVKTARVGGNRIQVRVKTNAKHSTVRAFHASGKQLATAGLRHRSGKAWVKVTLPKAANSAKRITVTSKRVKPKRNLVLLPRTVTKTVGGVAKPTSPAMPAHATEVLALVNQARSVARKCGSKSFARAGALTLHPALNRASQGHADDMATHNYFSHTGRNGSTPSKRANDAGYKGSYIGENIAAGQRTATAVVNAWLASPGHCENIMNANYKHLGVGLASNSASQFGLYWVQNFGRQ